MLDYLRSHPGVRDVVVSGGDVANLPWKNLEAFVAQLLEIENIRDIRLATKALMGLPQHWLQDEVRAGMERLATTARARGVQIAIHTHVNARAVGDAAGRRGDPGDARHRHPRRAQPGRAHARRQRLPRPAARPVLHAPRRRGDHALLLLHVRHDPVQRALAGLGAPTPSELQHAIMGYLPGFATPRIVCDVPYVGKRWVHQLEDYDRERGISYWTKNYRTGIELERPRGAAAAATSTTTRSTPCRRGPGVVARARRRRR